MKTKFIFFLSCKQKFKIFSFLFCSKNSFYDNSLSLVFSKKLLLVENGGSTLHLRFPVLFYPNTYLPKQSYRSSLNKTVFIIAWNQWQQNYIIYRIGFGVNIQSFVNQPKHKPNLFPHSYLILIFIIFVSGTPKYHVPQEFKSKEWWSNHQRV